MRAILGLVVALALGLLALTPYVVVSGRVHANVEVAATAGQERELLTAAKQYIQDYYSAVSANATAISPAIITVGMLESTGELSPDYTAVNPFGQTWQIEVLQPTPGHLQALLLSVGGATIPENEAPAIATEVGAAGGFVPYPGEYGVLNEGEAVGAYGHWGPVSLQHYTAPGRGHLAALLAYDNGNLQNDFLYRVAVPGQPQLNQMQTNIDMTGNDINSASGYAVQGGGALDSDQGGSLELGGNNSTAGTGNPYIDFHLGGQGVQDFNARIQNTAPDTLSLYGANGNGSLNVQGRIGAAGEPANSGYPAGWSGGIHSWDVYANGSVGVGTNGSLGGWLQNNGYGGVSDTFSVGSRLELGTSFGSANPGWGCSPNGEIAADANGSGQLMSCVDGQWKAAGASGDLTQAFSAGCSGGGASVSWTNPYPTPAEVFFTTNGNEGNGTVAANVYNKYGQEMQAFDSFDLPNGTTRNQHSSVIVPGNGSIVAYAANYYYGSESGVCLSGFDN